MVLIQVKSSQVMSSHVKSNVKSSFGVSETQTHIHSHTFMTRGGAV